MYQTMDLPKIRGKNENEIYKNFVKHFTLTPTFFKHHFETLLVETKNDVKSEVLRKTANELYLKDKNPIEALAMYNDGLRYATYDTENYAIILANRSAVLFKMFKLEECIQDIDLCLKSQYPDRLKPKVYLRKCASYQKLGNDNEMKKTAHDLKLFFDSNAISKAETKKYQKELDQLLSKSEQVFNFSETFYQLPVIKKSEIFSDASSDVALNEDDGSFYVSSLKGIKKGQVLFVEKAYAFFPQKLEYCQFCLKRICNAIPCKTCINHFYCSEACQKLAWRQFHQWECSVPKLMVTEENYILGVALRIILKAFHEEIPFPPQKKNVSSDKYSSIYHSTRVFNNEELLQSYAKDIMFLVNCLRLKTNFFDHLKTYRNFTHKSVKDLMTMIGALFIRHMVQMGRNVLMIRQYLKDCTEVVGHAVCPSVAQLTHSCDPNTVYYFFEDTVVVKAYMDIEPNTKLTCSYRDFSSKKIPLKCRTELLWDFCGLKCNCRCCLEPMLNLEMMDSYICVTCSGPAVTRDRLSYKCLQCKTNFVMPPEITSQIRQIFIDFDKFLLFNDIKVAEDAVNRSKFFFQPCHWAYHDVYINMLVQYIENDDVIRALNIFHVLHVYLQKRMGDSTIDCMVEGLRHSNAVLHYLTKSDKFLPPDLIMKALEAVKVSLDKGEALCELLYPPCLKFFQLAKAKYLVHRIEHTINTSS